MKDLELIVTKGDGVPLPDQKQALKDFIVQASVPAFAGVTGERMRNLIDFANDHADREDASADAWEPGCSEAENDRANAVKYRQIARVLEEIAAQL